MVFGTFKLGPCCCLEEPIETCVTAINATAAYDSAIYALGVLWLNPTNAALADGLVASYAPPAFGQGASAGLKATNFGFAIPATAAITSVRFRWYGLDPGVHGLPGFAASNGIFKPGPALVLSGTYQPTRFANPPQFSLKLPSASGFTPWEPNLVAHDPAWSGATLTPAQINHVGFGVGFAYQGLPGSSDIELDYAQCEVCYTLPA